MKTFEDVKGEAKTRGITVLNLVKNLSWREWHCEIGTAVLKECAANHVPHGYERHVATRYIGSLGF